MFTRFAASAVSLPQLSITNWLEAGTRTIAKLILIAFTIVSQSVESNYSVASDAVNQRPCFQFAPSKNALSSGVREPKYDFTCFTDYERTDTIVTIVCLIENHSDTYALPIEWTKAGISFDRLGTARDTSLRCVFNKHDVEAEHVDVKPDRYAPVNYGPQAQFEQEAIVYVVQPSINPTPSASTSINPTPNASTSINPTPNASTSINPSTPGDRGKKKPKSRLRSCVAADFRQGKEDKKIHLEFETWADGRSFKCEVQNLSTNPVLLSIPALEEARRLERFRSESSWPTWKGGKELFEIRPTERGEHLIFAGAARSNDATDNVVSVVIFSEENPETALFVARMSLYLPRE
jgi:hypothetical protein